MCESDPAHFPNCCLLALSPISAIRASVVDPSSSVRRCLRPPPSSPTDVAPSFERRCGPYICVVCVPHRSNRRRLRPPWLQSASGIASTSDRTPPSLEGNPLTSLILAKQQLLSKPYKVPSFLPLLCILRALSTSFTASASTGLLAGASADALAGLSVRASAGALAGPLAGTSAGSEW
ncbi:hypothetical protein Taro_015872 [Colocasia esculenta]|uniref:Uncharacterized protein n=1 Tax=Colocasia esculenta TaxID=4460 RepID=A0A843UJ24_COLES|nr:hypothetical protein [Colocasia esculenta]